MLDFKLIGTHMTLVRTEEELKLSLSLQKQLCGAKFGTACAALRHALGVLELQRNETLDALTFHPIDVDSPL